MRLRAREETAAHVRNEFAGGTTGWLVQAGSVHIHLPAPTIRSQGVRAAGAVALGASGAVLLSRSAVSSRIAGALVALLAVGQLLALGRGFFGRRETVVPEKQLASAVPLLAGRVRAAYDREERLARVHDPVPLPVRWTAGPPELADHWINIRGDREEPLDLGGEIHDIVDVFERLPKRRLVVLGRAGAGKSVLALRLARALLDPGTPDGPVPVVLPLASWDPFTEGPLEWAAGRVAALCPELSQDETVRRAIAGALLQDGRVLPVFDGFDEINPAARTRALRELNRGLGRDRRFVLTSRPHAYATSVTAADALTAAAVVGIQPLTVAQLAKFLPRTTRLTSYDGTAITKWHPVLERLRAPGADPAARAVREALSTPLMVGLARAAYSDTRADPMELLDRRRFPSRRAVEAHLLDAFVPAVYDIALDDRAARGPWKSRRASKSLGFLARHLKAADTQELAWWRLDLALPPFAGWLALLLPLALVVAAMCWAGGGTATVDRWWWQGPLWVSFTGVALVAQFAGWTSTPAGELPGPRRWSFTRRWRPWRPFGSLSVPADPVSAPGPWELLRADRRVALTAGSLRLEFADPFLTSKTALLLVAPLAHVIWASMAGWGQSGPEDRNLVLAASVAAFFLQGALLSAWGRYTFARLWLASAGRLPWRLSTFLKDAHARGVLRQSGGRYYFRHMELRDRLAEGGPPGRGGVRLGLGTPAMPQAALRFPVLAFLALCFWLFTAPAFTADGHGPYERTAPACELLRTGDLAPVMASPEVTKLKGYEGRRCRWTEQGPGRGAVVELSVSTEHTTATGYRSARREADDRVRYAGESGRPEVAGLGDRASVGTEELPADWGDGYVGRAEGARVTARVGNVVVQVVFAEEYADARRELAVAVNLVRQALHNAGLDGGKAGGAAAESPARALARLPRPQPPAGSRHDRYRAVSAAPLLGPVWRGTERSDIHALKGVPFVFRGPRMRCSDPDGPGDTVTCTITPGQQSEGGELQLRVARCPGSPCGDADRERLSRWLYWSPVPSTAWKRHGAGTWYSQTPRPSDGSPDDYELQMLRVFSAGGRSYVMTFHIRTDPAHTDVARKTLNEIVAQTAPRASAPGEGS
ncbi:NACHT domain-containing protein [Streptomyces sp. NPDC005271]|uniref:NACHT domain-containing protein n=1 Tax=unclassified Streptomyces TaxID=2593676 RepID=UPI0033B18F55